MFSLACFVLIGVRGESWEPRLFLAIPIVTAIFSFLFCVSTLLGILTRSTIASLLVTLLIWFMIFIVNAADNLTMYQATMNAVQRERLPARIAQWEKTAANVYEDRVKSEREKAVEDAKARSEPTDALAKPEDAIPAPTREQLDAANKRLPDARARLAALEENAPNWAIARRIVRGVKFSLPKTQESAALLKRALLPPGIWNEDEKDDTGSELANFLMPSDMREV